MGRARRNLRRSTKGAVTGVAPLHPSHWFSAGVLRLTFHVLEHSKRSVLESMVNTCCSDAH